MAHSDQNDPHKFKRRGILFIVSSTNNVVFSITAQSKATLFIDTSVGFFVEYFLTSVVAQASSRFSSACEPRSTYPHPLAITSLPMSSRRLFAQPTSRSPTGATDPSINAPRSSNAQLTY